MNLKSAFASAPPKAAAARETVPGRCPELASGRTFGARELGGAGVVIGLRVAREGAKTRRRRGLGQRSEGYLFSGLRGFAASREPSSLITGVRRATRRANNRPTTTQDKRLKLIRIHQFRPISVDRGDGR